MNSEGRESEIQGIATVGGGGDQDDNDRYSGKEPDGHDDVRAFEIDPKASERIKLVTWFLLLVVFMTFVGIIAAYVVVSTNQALEWNPFQLPLQVWVSTALLLASSASFEISHRSRIFGRQLAARNWLLVTASLGAVFIASQVLAWIGLYRAGYYLQSNPYAGFFYLFTALHAIHLVGGVSALGYLLLRGWYPTLDDHEATVRVAWSKSVGLYWHCMDGLWILLVALLAFWK